jgi:hypothetical protein
MKKDRPVTLNVSGGGLPLVIKVETTSLFCPCGRPSPVQCNIATFSVRRPNERTDATEA